MPSQYPRIYREPTIDLYREPVIDADEIRQSAFQGAKRSKLMLVSCTEQGGWHKIENAEVVLAHFVLAPEQPQARASAYRSITKVFLGFILLVVAAGAGAFGNVVLMRANEFFIAPKVGPAISAPALAANTAPAVATTAAQPLAATTAPTLAATTVQPLATTAIATTSTPPIVATQEAPAPVTFSLAEGVGRAVDQIRAGLPRQIDALVSVIGVKNEGTTIIYENKIAMDGTKINNAKKGKMTEQIVANTCNTPGPRRLLELGVAFRYLYVDMREKPVMTTDVTKQDCI